MKIIQLGPASKKIRIRLILWLISLLCFFPGLGVAIWMKFPVVNWNYQIWAYSLFGLLVIYKIPALIRDVRNQWMNRIEFNSDALNIYRDGLAISISAAEFDRFCYIKYDDSAIDLVFINKKSLLMPKVPRDLLSLYGDNFNQWAKTTLKPYHEVHGSRKSPFAVKDFESKLIADRGLAKKS